MSQMFILGFFMIVVGIPVIGGIASRMYQQRLQLREKELEMLGNQTAERAAQYAAQTERLEERVRVLERILTDRGITVAAEIEALRDTEQRRLPQD
jgi:ABC-type phosphate transport system auxiliary subunit